MAEDLWRRLEAANDRLRKGRVGVVLEFRGKKLNLYMRGVFPPAPGSKKVQPYQQRIALKMRATPEAIALAEQQAKLVGLELNMGRFDWGRWSDAGQDTAGSVGAWVDKFERDYFTRRGDSNETRTTWDSNYIRAFKLLPREEQLTIDLLIRVTESTPANSKARRDAAIALGALARMAEIDPSPLRRLRGGYSEGAASERELPTDAAIVAGWEWTYQNQPYWAWVYGMIATYGLRPHEVFKVEGFEKFPYLRIRENTKTGSRAIAPLCPEWANEWRLNKKIISPHLEVQGTEPNKKMGGKVSRWFYNNDEHLPCEAYDLRHCWARRAVEFGVEASVAAKLMGHSLKRHLQTYRRWIGDEAYLEAFRRAIAQRDE